MTLHMKTAVVLLVTLVIGFMLGLATSRYLMISHMRDGKGKPERFKRLVVRILDLDEEQQRQAAPMLEEHEKRIRETNEQHRDRMLASIDSLKAQMLPILRAEQVERLENFHERLRSIRGRPPGMGGPRGPGKPGRPRRPGEQRPDKF
jgi:hypothetical protein